MKGVKKVFLEGRGQITLRQSDHIATGGEGSVFASGKSVVKIYTDKQKMKRDGMDAKIRLLTIMQHKSIVAPRGLVLDTKNNPIGYYMDRVDGESLSRLFTNDFRNRIGFVDGDVQLLAERMKDAISFAHSKNAILVDANELNYLVGLKKTSDPKPYLIDVDSWAIGSWKPSVIMPSIRDWHTKGFTELSDWFAWGIVTFSLFSGIHPYKGTHPNFKRGDMEGRMKSNTSVFSSGVRLNHAVRDFASIPGPLLDWYTATFEHGERSIPPSPLKTGNALGVHTRVKRVVTTGVGLLVADKVFSGDSSVVQVFPSGVVLQDSGVLFDLVSKRQIGIVSDISDVEIVAVPGGWLVANKENNKYAFSFINKTSLLQTKLNASTDVMQMLRYNERLFVVSDVGLSELVLHQFSKPVLTFGTTWQVLTNSTKWYDGIGIQDALGAQYLVVPTGESGLVHVRTHELDGLHVVSALSGEHFAVCIVVTKSGEYERIEFVFNNSYTTYSVQKEIVDTPDLNCTFLPKMVGAIIENDGELSIFVPSSGVVKKVTDKFVTTTIRLTRWGNTVLGIRGNDVWSIRLK